MISGPFNKEDAESRLQVGNPPPMIWGRGQAEWATPEKWRQILRDGDPQDRRQHNPASERMWKVRMGAHELKPMTHDQMIDYLRAQSDHGEIRIWTEGYNDWKDIFQIHKIMDELGVSRRNHPRVPIMGTLTCEGATGNLSVRALSISEGGLGVTDAHSMKIGERFKILLKSPNLYNPIHATAEVVYIGGDGYAGLKFLSLHAESKSAIIEYVKKFTDLKTNV